MLTGCFVEVKRSQARLGGIREINGEMVGEDSESIVEFYGMLCSGSTIHALGKALSRLRKHQ